MNTNLDIIKSEINRVIEELDMLFSIDNSVYREINSFILGNSKRIRATISILFIKANNKEVNNNAIKLISAGELIHNASLLHDDIIDNAQKRRGKDTIGKIFSSDISILSGDFVLSLAIRKLMEIQNNDITESFLDCVEKMIRAEISQNLLLNKIPSESDYIRICEGKTAELFGTIIKNAAILSEIDYESGYNFGKLFGTVFQIKNDTDLVSAEQDKYNGTKTSLEVLGVEKTIGLIDNYKEQMRNILSRFPRNIYKETLENLVNNL